jgi:hypothetical protein
MKLGRGENGPKQSAGCIRNLKGAQTFPFHLAQEGKRKGHGKGHA